MHRIASHFTRVFLAGIIALLPIGGTVLTIAYMESAISESFLTRQAFYIPGMGLAAAAALIYLIGLGVTTFVGRWAFGKADRLFDSLPGLGALYQTVKQILGYGAGKDAVFLYVVLVKNRELDGAEIGLVTSEIETVQGKRLVVFVPGAPTPTAGRLLLLPETSVTRTNMAVSDAIKAILSVGKIPMSEFGA